MRDVERLLAGLVDHGVEAAALRLLRQLDESAALGRRFGVAAQAVRGAVCAAPAPRAGWEDRLAELEPQLRSYVGDQRSTALAQRAAGSCVALGNPRRLLPRRPDRQRAGRTGRRPPAPTEKGENR